MPILSVRLVTWFGARLNLIVVGLFLPRNWMAGNVLGSSTPAVKVVTFHGLMRTSDGCIWTILSAFNSPAGVPSHSPILKTVEGVVSVDVRFSVVVEAAVTVAESV